MEEKLNNKTKYTEIGDLIGRIEKVAFKISLDKNNPSEGFVEIIVFNPTRVKGELSYNRIRIWNSPIEENDVEVILNIIHQFIGEIADRIWNHKRLTKFPDLTRKSLMKVLKEDYKLLNSIRKLLKSRGYRPNTIQEAIRPLRIELNTHIKWALQAKVFQTEVEIRPHDLVRRENIVIDELKQMYKNEELQADGSHKTVSLFNTNFLLNPRILDGDSSPKLEKLSDRQIASSMAIIFSATDFWGNKTSNFDIAENIEMTKDRRREIYFERIRKRFKSKKRLDFLMDLKESDFNW